MLSRAYAKINLSLDITGVREDGYHTLESIFLPLDFYDELSIEKADNMSFECNLPFIAFNSSNTVYQAIELMKKEYKIEDNFKIKLKKHIPTKAGLGGGSSDGAAAIRLINRMYGLHLCKEKVQELCLKIGADVLFTYYNRPAFVSGIGEKIEFINLKKKYYVLLVKPRYGVSTSECYRLIGDNPKSHPDIHSLRSALENGDDYYEFLGNSMEEAAISLLPDIQKVKDSIMEAGAEFALMSGSGSTVFTMSEDEELIKKIYKSLEGKGYFIRHTEILTFKN